MKELLENWVGNIPVLAGYATPVTSTLSVLLILFGSTIVYFVVKRVLVRLITRLIVKTESQLDDILLRHRIFSRVAYLVPAWIIYTLVPTVLPDYPLAASAISTLVAVCMVIVAALIVDSIIDSLVDIYHSFPISREVPVQNFGQVAKLLTYFIALIGVAALLLGESPFKLFAGLGAMTAVLMLVFRDPILGFVAGLQLSYNRMVALGDWVDIPQHNASGDILEIGLTTVKVRNFDNTITTVPTQALINESFKNWRGMQESGGRRIMRSILLDLNSIRFCDEEALERYSKIDHIKDYLADRQADIEEHNLQHVANPDSPVNGRRLTNVGTFRAYVQAYLENHPNINQSLTLLVRQLAPTEVGLPIQIYAFSSEKNWARYETIQADIFDHLLAVAREFDLRVFQKPAGSDLQSLAGETV